MTNAVWAAVVTVVFLVASCGGGDGDGVGVAQPSAAAAAPSSAIDNTAGSGDQPRLDAAVTPQTLFDWAQQNLPQFFAGAGVDGFAFPFTYRYFQQTRSFVAVSATDGGVYVLGPDVSNNQVRFVIPFGLFKCRIAPDACPILPVGDSVIATVSAADEHWYAVFLSAGQPYVFDLEGKPTGHGTLEDPVLRLFNGAGQRLTTDDDSGVSLNSRIVCAPSSSGWHFVAAGGFEGEGGSYRLSATVANAAAPDCASIIGDGSVNWESPVSATGIVAAGATLAAGQAQGWAFDIGGGALPVDLIFVARYGASLHLTTAESVGSCASGGTFTPYASFDGRSAGWSITLPPGSYGLCVRDTSGLPNVVRLELKHQPTVTGFHVARQRFGTVGQTVEPGGRFVQPAATGIDYRTLLEGANTGGTFHIVHASQTQNFLAGLPFDHNARLTAACAPAGTAAPELCELTEVQEYVIAYHNDTSTVQSILIIGRDYVPD